MPPALDSDAFAAATSERLMTAFRTGTPIEPPSEAMPGMSVEVAYDIQRRLTDLHRALGRRVVGRKIGLTSRAIQAQLGVDSPDYGVILNSHVFASGATLSRRECALIAPRLEPELAFVLDRPLRGPGLRRDDVLAATRAVVGVMELIDSRVVDWRIALEDTVADNASCFGVITGTAVPLTGLGDLAAVRGRIDRDGELVTSGEGAAVLGHPAEAVAWLANELARHDDELPAGELVLSGSFSAAVDAAPGRYEAVFSEPLEPVVVTVTE